MSFLRSTNKNNEDEENLNGVMKDDTTNTGDDDSESKNQGSILYQDKATYLQSNSLGTNQTAPPPQRPIDNDTASKKTQEAPDASQQVVTPPQPGQENQGAQGVKPGDNNGSQGSSSSDKTDGWLEVFNRYKKLDEDWIQQINDYIGTLLVFAGLFATVLTAFLVAVYAELQPDNTQSATPILLDLSKQLHAISLGQVAPVTIVSVTPTSPDPLHVVTTVLWLLSLVVSLGAALLGILIKQWLREYMRWTSIFPVQHAVHIRYHRRQNLDMWHVEGIMTTISMGLTIGLVLFFLGLAVLSFNTNFTVAVAAATTTGFVLLVTSVVVILPVFVPSCPFRSPFSSFLLLASSFALQTSVRAKKQLIKWLNRWCQLLLTKNELDTTEKRRTWIGRAITRTAELVTRRDGILWTADVWSKWDGILHFSDDPMKSVLDKWRSLFWLISHQPVPDELVVQCFSDLPGPPPPSLEHANAGDLEGAGWQARGRVETLKLQFRCQCRILLDLLDQSTKDFPDSPKKSEVKNLSAFLYAYVGSSDVEDDSDEPPQVFDIDLGRASKLHAAIQGINPLSRNSLLRCVSSLTNTVLSRHLFFSDSMEFNFFSNLLGIYFMLVNSLDPELGKTGLYDSYHRTLVNIISADESSVYTHRDSSKDPSSSVNLEILKQRIEFAGTLLSFSSSSSFYGTLHWKLDINTVILCINAAVQLIHKPTSSSNLYRPSADAGRIYRKITTEGQKFSLSTRVFWALATIVVNTRGKGGLDKQEKYRKQIGPFLEAVKVVLKTEITDRIKWSEQDYNDRSDLVDFFVLHRQHLPSDFVATLQEAHQLEIMDIDQMLLCCSRYIVTPDTGEYLLSSSAYITFVRNVLASKPQTTTTSSKP